MIETALVVYITIALVFFAYLFYRFCVTEVDLEFDGVGFVLKGFILLFCISMVWPLLMIAALIINVNGGC